MKFAKIDAGRCLQFEHKTLLHLKMSMHLAEIELLRFYLNVFFQGYLLPLIAYVYSNIKNKKNSWGSKVWTVKMNSGKPRKYFNRMLLYRYVRMRISGVFSTGIHRHLE